MQKWWACGYVICAMVAAAGVLLPNFQYISRLYIQFEYTTRTSWHAFMGHGELRVTPQPPNRVCVDELRAAARRRVLARRRRRMLLEQARGEER